MLATVQARIAFLTLLLAASPLGGQVRVTEGPLAPEVQEEILGVLNAPETLRFPGNARIPASAAIEADVAVLGGPAEVAGEITGSLLVVNGDLRFLSGAVVTGDVTVVGGLISGEEGARIDGQLTRHAYPLRYRIRADRVEALPEPILTPGFLSSDLGFGQARVTLRAGPTYNRIEGLPVRFGPIVQTAGSNPLVLEMFGIWRSVSGLNFESDRLGYHFRIQQALGGRGLASVGATAHSQVVEMESRGMTDAEASLSTFLLRRDLRDYHDREGWSAFLSLTPARLPASMVIAFREERHDTPPIRNPWTLRSSHQPWRPLALTAEGRARFLETTLHWDSSDDPTHPSDGWRIALGAEHQLGGELRLPPSAPGIPTGGEAPTLEEAEILPRFSRASLDVRRYARVGPTSRLNLRAAAVTDLTGDPLPPQLQSSLGGEGSLPGHPRFAVDCGARETVHSARTGEGNDGRTIEGVYPAYGCDRTVLFQAEFQGALPVSWNPVPDEWEDSELSAFFELQPVWAVFLNAGRGWAMGELGNAVPRTDSPTRADVGVGLFLGPLGLYWSYPLNRQDRGLNFFVRLHQRF